MKEQTICFTGHREIRENEQDIREKLKDMLEYYISYGYVNFAAGGARGFDALAAEVVLELQKKYPQIALILVLPFPNQYTAETGWTESEIFQYKNLEKSASEVIFTGENYKRGCYYKRNRLLVSMSSICVCYQYKKSGGTAYTVRYAEEEAEIPVINIRNLLPSK